MALSENVFGCEGVVSCVVGMAVINLAAEVLANLVSEAPMRNFAVVGNITTKGVQPHSWPLSAAALFFVGFNKQKQRELQYLNVWQVHIHFIGTNRI